MEKLKVKNRQMVVSELVRDKDIINLNPPYQRKEVWEDTYKRNLILSMIDDLPINAIHLVTEDRQDGGESYIVLDGKQRLTSIYGFFNNEFRIPLSFIKSSKEEFYAYKDLKKFSETKDSPYKEEAAKILRNLSRYPVQTIEWEPMPYISQGIIFNKINYSKELSVEERLLAENFYAKTFVEFIIKNYIPNLSKLSKFSDDSRSKDLIWGLRLLYVFFNGQEGLSTELNADVNKILTASYGKSKNGALKIFARALHDKIIDYLDKNKDKVSISFFDEKDIKKMIGIDGFNWEKRLKTMSTYLEYIGSHLFSSVRKKAKKNYVPQNKVNAWSLLYFSSFILEKSAGKEITINLLIQNKKAFDTFSCEYLKWVLSDSMRTRRQMQKDSFNAHITILNKLYSEMKLDVGDLGVKNNHIPDDVKQITLLKANGKCQKCGNETNLQIDHVNPISLFSESDYQILCELCNRQKSDTLQVA